MGGKPCIRGMRVTAGMVLGMLASGHSHEEILKLYAEIEESDEDKPGVILDYDADGNVVSIEILDASKRIRNLRLVEMAVVG